MQVQNIQRPALFSDFFNLELIWNNEYLTYIQSSMKNVTSTIHNIVNTSTNTIKKSLNTIYYRSIDNPFIRECTALKRKHSITYTFVHSKNQEVLIFIRPDYEKELDYNNDYKKFSIFDIFRNHISVHTV